MRLIDADALDKRIYNEIPISVFGSIKKMAKIREIIDEQPTVDAVEELKELRDFAIWVADEIFEAEDAPDNPFDYGYGGAFAEIACRKLHKLGIVEMKGKDWHYEPTKTAQD